MWSTWPMLTVNPPARAHRGDHVGQDLRHDEPPEVPRKLGLRQEQPRLDWAKPETDKGSFHID